ncbi:hypothetical protein CUMW_167050, partial [Citrus unshiu]
MYKSDYNWDQHTSNLMERCPDFNPLKYSRDVYSSHWGKEADCLHSILFEEGNTPTCIVGVRTAALQVGEQQLSPLGQRPSDCDMIRSEKNLDPKSSWDKVYENQDLFQNSRAAWW